MSGRFYVGFLPWIVFAFVGRAMSEGVAWGGVVAVVTALALVASSARTRSVKLLEVGAVVLFTGLAIAGAFQQHNPHGLLQHYARSFSASGLALLALGSLLFVPLTEPYAREIVLRRFWSTPRFKRVNVELTLMWAVVFTAIALSHAAAPTIGTRLSGTIFHWIVPVGVAVLGVKQASLRWSDQFDGDVMGLDAMLNQVEFWDPTLAVRRETRAG